MKKLKLMPIIKKLPLALLLFTLFACSKSNMKPGTASLDVVIYQKDTLMGDDSAIAHLANASIAVWKENTSGEITVKNATDEGNGVGYNHILKKDVKADFYVSSADSLTIKNIDPGLYFIYVVDHYKYNIAFPHSFKEVEVKGDVRLPKVFNYSNRNLNSPWG